MYIPLLSIIAVFVLSLFFSPYTPTVQAIGGSLSGYAWSSTVGWISFNGSTDDGGTYGVSISSTDNQTLSGYAWSPAIGWITFGSNSCGSQAKLVGGALQGWAEALSADDNGWDGCISLSGSTYGPSIAGGVNQSGTFNNASTNNYAWGSAVVGWVDFNQVSATMPGIITTYPIVSFTVSPSRVRLPGSVTLNWSLNTNIAQCGITNSDGATIAAQSGDNATSGSHSISGVSVTKSTLYTLSCSDSSLPANVYTQTVSVDIVPVYIEI